jgi:transmembrane sensor
VVRLHGSVSDAGAESDWLAFDAWLNAAPGNRAAYDAAESLWNQLGRQSGALRKGLGDGAKVIAFPRRGAAPGPLWWAATAAAAASLLLFIGPFSLLNAPQPTVYSTAKGERRAIQLPDGSRMWLNSGSQASVRLDGRRREVELAQGSEAAFTVVHDASRPFVVHAGDRTIRDLGTEFDVLSANGDLKVTVRTGQVEVAPAAGASGPSFALTPGRALFHKVGSTGSDVTSVQADDAFGWSAGRLIYRNRSLTDVAADLNRYYGTPVRVEGPAANLTFSGVLEVSSEAAVINRLAALVPVSANSQDGVIILRKRTASR